MRETKNPTKLYVSRTFTLMGIYSAINIAAIFGLFDHLEGLPAVILALAVSLPIIGQIGATLILMRDSDEFLRGLMARRFIAATGITMALFTTWGFLEIYAHASHAPTCLIMPAFWGAFGLVSPFIQSTRA